MNLKFLLLPNQRPFQKLCTVVIKFGGLLVCRSVVEYPALNPTIQVNEWFSFSSSQSVRRNFREVDIYLIISAFWPPFSCSKITVAWHHDSESCFSWRKYSIVTLYTCSLKWPGLKWGSPSLFSHLLRAQTFCFPIQSKSIISSCEFTYSF